MSDLGRTDNFVGSLLSKEDIKEREKQIAEASRLPQLNGNPLPFRTDTNPRFSEPPAPPPQQPLPEKPDMARSHPLDTSSPSLKRSNTERPRSVPSISPIREQTSSQIITLVEALATAKKEIDTQSARLRDLEEMLQKERQAREMAEEVAKRLELESEAKMNGHAISGDSLVLQETFEPPLDLEELQNDNSLSEKTVNPVAISETSSQLERRLETMLGDMKELREQMESFKKRAENAETERDADRKTLAEMVDKIRAEESARRSSSTERARSPTGQSLVQRSRSGDRDLLKATLSPLLNKTSVLNGSASNRAQESDSGQGAVGILPKQNTGHDPILYNTTPYASMVGVVLLGMGLMAYLNGWQQPKVDR